MNRMEGFLDDPQNLDNFLDEKELAEAEFSRRCELENGSSIEPLAEARRVLDFFFRGLRMLLSYQGDKLMALDAFALSLGQGAMITGIDPKELPVVNGDTIPKATALNVAIKHYGDPSRKATVTKCVKMFQDCMGTPPMPGQRSEAGRNKMREARNGQLKMNGHKNGK